VRGLDPEQLLSETVEPSERRQLTDRVWVAEDEQRFEEELQLPVFHEYVQDE